MALTQTESKTMGFQLDDQPGRAGILTLLILFVLPFVYLPPGRVFASTTFYHHYLKLTLFQTAAAALWMSMLFRGGVVEASRRARGLVLPALLVLLWSALTLLWSYRPWVGVHALVVQASYLAGATGLMYVLASKQARDVFVALLGVSSAAAAVTIAAVYFHGQYAGKDYFFFPNKNLAAAFLVMPAVVGLSFALRAKASMAGRIPPGVLTALCLLGMVATECLGSLVAFGVGAVAFAAVRFRPLRWPILGLAVVVVALLSVVVVGQTLDDGFMKDTVDIKEYLGIRPLIWRGSIRSALERPFIGSGLGTYFIVQPPNQVPEYFFHRHAAPSTRHAHCQPLETVVEQGVVGLVLFVVFIVFLLRAAFGLYARMREDRPSDGALALGLGCGALAMVAHALVLVMPNHPDSQINFWLAVAFLGGLMLDRDGKPLPRGTSPLMASWGGYAVGAVILMIWGYAGVSDASKMRQLSVAGNELKAAATNRNAAQKKEQLESAATKLLTVARWPLCEPFARLSAWRKLSDASQLMGNIQGSINTRRLIVERAPHYAGTNLNLAELYVRYALILEEQARRAKAAKPPNIEAGAVLDKKSVRSWITASNNFGYYCGIRPAPAVVFKRWIDAILHVPPDLRGNSITHAGDAVDLSIKSMPLEPLLWVHKARLKKISGDQPGVQAALKEGASRCEGILRKLPPGGGMALRAKVYEAWLAMDFLSAGRASLIGPAMPLIVADANAKTATLRMRFLLGNYYARIGAKQQTRAQFLRVAAECQGRLAQRNDIEMMEILAQAYRYVDETAALRVCSEILKRSPGGRNRVAETVRADIRKSAARKKPAPKVKGK